MTQAYPLQWPQGWPRARFRKGAQFGKKDYNPGTMRSVRSLSIAEGTGRVVAELRALGVHQGKWIISTNLLLRNDGLPRSEQRAPTDPGVAVYWTRDGQAQKVMAIDVYDKVQDNLAAIAATLNAMRAIERHGGAQILERAFTGFDALPAPDARDPYAIMGLQPGPFDADILAGKFRELAAKHHPDKAGGNIVAFQNLVWARDEIKRRNGIQ